VSVCLSVCLTQVGVRSKRPNESNWFWYGSFLPSILHCAKINSGIFKNKGTSLWNFVPNSGLRKFCFGISIVETCYQLSLRNVDAQSVINWTVVGQLSWQYLPSSDARPLVYHSNHQALSTAQFNRAGQLATADTCTVR